MTHSHRAIHSVSPPTSHRLSKSHSPSAAPQPASRPHWPESGSMGKDSGRTRGPRGNFAWRCGDSAQLGAPETPLNRGFLVLAFSMPGSLYFLQEGSREIVQITVKKTIDFGVRQTWLGHHWLGDLGQVV